MIQGGMNLVWTTRAPFLRAVRDRVFCDGAANEGVADADTSASLQPRGYAPVSRTLPAVKPTKHAQVPPSLTLRGRHDVGDELVHREPSGVWPEAPPPGF